VRRLTVKIAKMRQLKLNQLPTDKEIGQTLCMGPDGLKGGPLATGHYYGVTIPIQCPAGYKPIGTWHTHPGGIPKPSNEDWRMTRKHNLRYCCITVPDTGETRCFSKQP